MHDPRTIWLIVTNIVLAVLVLLAVWGVATNAICEFVARVRKRRAIQRELDQEMERFFGHGR